MPLGQFLCFSPDGDTLAVGNWDGTVRLWDPKSRRLKDTLQAESPRVAAVAFSSDGRILVARYRFWLTFWDTAKYGEGKKLESHSSGNSLAICPGRNLLVAGDRAGLGPEIWDVAQERVEQVIDTYDFRVFCLKFSPDGHLLAMGGEKSAILWDLVENSKRFEFEGSWIMDVAFTPDGRTLATAGENGLRFWNTETGFPVDSFRAPQKVRSITYSPDGRLLATGDYGGRVTVWDIATGKEIWSALVDWQWKPSASAWAGGIVALILFVTAGLWTWKARRGGTAA
jgi:WD40 repeat protein